MDASCLESIWAGNSFIYFKELASQGFTRVRALLSFVQAEEKERCLIYPWNKVIYGVLNVQLLRFISTLLLQVPRYSKLHMLNIL